jgi:5-methylcytosine-specific restriction endonuclease McrA
MSNETRLSRLCLLSGTELKATRQETQVKLRELVELLRGAQPIRRASLWPAELIRHLAELQNKRCPACGEAFELNTGEHHVDHIIPWSLGGGNETANIQILHARCNMAKGARANIDDVIRYLQGRIRNI